MGYAETLSKIVKDSGLTLRQIANKCEAKGIPLDPSYISKLQTAKQGPASDEISRAIAEVCGGNPELLVLEGYLEKASPPIRDLISNLIKAVKQIGFVAIGNFLDKEVIESLEEQFSTISDLELVFQFLEIIAQLQANPSSISSVNESSGIELQQNITLKCNDDSMAPRIPQGSTVKLLIQSKYLSNDVVALSIQGEGSVLFRRVIFEADRVLLLPENNKYEMRFCKQEEIQIIGAVKSVTVDI